MSEWIKAKHAGLRYREHDTRTTGVGKSKRPLRYYVQTYKWQGKTISEAFGWEGDFIHNEDGAYQIFLELKQNRKNRIPPFTLKERNEIREIELSAAQEKQQSEQSRNVSFADIFGRYLIYSKGNKRSEKSWKREEQLARLHIFPSCGSLPLSEIAPSHLECVKNNMAIAGLSSRSIQYALAVVRQIFNYAIREGVFTGQNPAAGGIVARPKEDNKKTRYLSRDEAKALLEELSTRSEEVHDMALLSLYTGMRFGEIAKLIWIDVDFTQNCIMLKNTKSGKNRPAFMTHDVKTMLSQRYKGEKDRLVFPARGFDNKPHAMISHLYYNVVRIMFNQDVSDKRDWVNFHTLRHTFASWLVEGDTSIYFVKELLGHSDLKLTERYSHNGKNQLKQAVQKLQKI